MATGRAAMCPALCEEVTAGLAWAAAGHRDQLCPRWWSGSESVSAPRIRLGCPEPGPLPWKGLGPRPLLDLWSQRLQEQGPGTCFPGQAPVFLQDSEQMAPPGPHFEKPRICLEVL